MEDKRDVMCAKKECGMGKKNASLGG